MKIPTLIAVSILAALSAFPLRAQTTVTTPIVVPNASFETYTSPGWTFSNSTIASGWVFNVGHGSEFGVGSISSDYSSEGAASGSSYAFINNDYPGVVDTITSAASLGTITAETTYTLSVAIGNPSAPDHSLYGQPGPVSFSLLANGQVFATTTVPNYTVANGTFQDFSLTYTTPSTGSIIGDSLTIQLATLPEEQTAYKPGFDKVTLDEVMIEAAPEPATSILVVLGSASLVGLMLWRRLGRISLKTGLAVGLFIMAGLASVSADPIDVPNASFETSSSGGGWTYNNPDTISDWTFNAPAGSAYGQLWLVFFNSAGTSSGSQCAFIDNTSSGEPAFLTSDASLGTIAADTTYTLSVAVGNADLNNPDLEKGPLVFDPIGDTPPAGVSLALLANGQPFAIDPVPAGLVAGGTWQDFTLSYTTTDSDPIVGEQLTIQLGTEPGSGQAEAASFDNVRLDATAIASSGDGNVDSGGGGGDAGAAPEPPSLALLGAGLATLGWLSRWQRCRHEAFL
jgi:hypothetical protein